MPTEIECAHRVREDCRKHGCAADRKPWSCAVCRRVVNDGETIVSRDGAWRCAKCDKETP